MEQARRGWLAWNEEWAAEGLEPLYHETGVLMVCRDPMTDGGYEFESWRMLLKRAHRPDRLDRAALAERFPAWNSGRYVDGFYHARGGYAESGRVVEALLRRAQRDGVELRPTTRVGGLLERGGRVGGVRCDDGSTVEADAVVLAAGAWTNKLIPGLASSIRATGHAVFHLRPSDPELFKAERFPVFTADVARTGYYGFPLSREGVVKVANHGLGRPIDPDASRAVTEEDEGRLRAFLAQTFPALVQAPIEYTRLCLYADTQDEDLWIARDPDLQGLSVASGGSGHGFKFAPVLGGLTADAVEGKDNPLLEKFRWRPELVLEHGHEAARCHLPLD
jgi:glycine/D-amino acid oxidase-like deaminating enzyme